VVAQQADGVQAEVAGDLRADAAFVLPEAVATRTVRARSAAEIPVVAPWRASMDSQKAVPKREVFSAAMGRRCSSSQRSGVSARQISPRP
jgi:hypothetical protein